MRLLVDSVAMSSPGAVELKTALIDALARTTPAGASLVVVGPTRDPLDGGGQFTVRPIGPSQFGLRSRWWWGVHGLPTVVQAERADVVFAMSGQFSSRLLRVSGVVTTANNMLPFTPDLLRDLPWRMRLKMRLLGKVFVHGLRIADAAVLHSTHALTQLTAGAPALRAKCAVVLTGIPTAAWLSDDAPRPAHPYGGRPYFFYLSTMQRYKNHLRLIAAYAQVATGPDGAGCPDLVLAGIPADRAYVAQVTDVVHATGLGDRVRYLGALDRAALPAWMHHAHANIFASLCETNSVIQAEILGAGGVMACSGIPPMDEVAGDAAILFNPADTEAMAVALTRLIREPALRDHLRSAAAARRQALSWDRCGEVIWAQAHVAYEQSRQRMTHG
jgi:glycosyltransferase involved in cell wall biosynthesis